MRSILPALMAGASVALTGGAAVAKNFHISISGDEGARFVGTCAVAKGSTGDVLTLDGVVPHEQMLVGDGLSCKLKAEGQVVILIEHDGSRARSSTNGGTINIDLK